MSAVKAVTGSGRYPVEDKRSDLQCSEAYVKLIQDLGIQDSIDIWAQNMRNRIAENVVQHVIKGLKANDLEFNRLALHIYEALKGNMLQPQEEAALKTCDPALQDTKIACMEAILRRNSNAHGEIQRFMAAAKAREGLNKYLCAGGDSKEAKAYCFSRLTQLAKGYCLNEYVYDRSTEEGKGLPTDALLVMHSFVTFLDQQLGDTFARRYYEDRGADKHKGAKHGEAYLVQARKAPDVPYFMMYVSKKDKDGKEKEVEWCVEPGRSNLFICLALFVFYVHQKMRKRLGHLHLNDISSLGSILE